MTLREEIVAKFDNIVAEVDKRISPTGVLQREGEPDRRFAIINGNFAAITDSLLLLADEIDKLKQQN